MHCPGCLDLFQGVFITELGVGIIDRVSVVLQRYLGHVVWGGACVCIHVNTCRYSLQRYACRWTIKIYVYRHLYLCACTCKMSCRHGKPCMASYNVVGWMHVHLQDTLTFSGNSVYSL